MADKEKYTTIATGVRKRAGGTYEFSVSAGFDGSGKHIRKYGTFVPPKGVSEAKADKLALEAFADFARKARGNKAFGENMRFSDLCELYFENYAPNKLKKVITCLAFSGLTNFTLDNLSFAEGSNKESIISLLLSSASKRCCSFN